MYNIISRNCIRRISKVFGLRTNSSYVVLLPEDPVDTTDNNALLRLAEGGHPDFTQLTPDTCYNGVGKLAIDFECGLWDIEEKIRDDVNNASVSTVIEPLDRLDAKLNAGWNAAKVLYTTRQDILSQKTYLTIHDRARKARVHKYHSVPVYNACKNMKSTLGESMSPCLQRIVSKFTLESCLNGIELSPEKASHFVNVIKKLDKFKAQFRHKVAVSTSRFRHIVSDEDVLKSFPKELVYLLSSDGKGSRPWTVTLKPAVYNQFLAHCSVRGLRWNVWQAYNMRASKQMEQQADNSVNIEEIRKGRREQAQILGYETFAHLSMETKMAGSVDNVLSMITTLQADAVPRQMEDMQSLAEFAASEGFGGDALQAYDVPYYRRLQKQKLYGITTKLHEYLPFERVWNVLLQLSSQLFGVEYEEVAPGDQLKAWHADVRLFNVIDKNGGLIASFYLDPYRREGQKLNPRGNSAWSMSLQNRNTLCDHPTGALIFNFTPPTENNHHTLLSLEEVVIMFSKFGEALQHLLTTAPYGEASGLTNIEWDATAMTQHFMANWVFVPDVLASLCEHHRTGATLSNDELKQVTLAGNHMAAHTLCKHLYKSQIDIALHTRTEFWNNIVNEYWPQFMPYQLDKNDFHVCSFTECLADVWAAAYYSHTWARVMAADCTAAFINEQDWAATGRRFRDTFLSLGGGEHSAEVFRQFRGRDPAPSALLELYDIKPTTPEPPSSKGE